MYVIGHITVIFFKIKATPDFADWPVDMDVVVEGPGGVTFYMPKYKIVRAVPAANEPNSVDYLAPTATSDGHVTLSILRTVPGLYTFRLVDDVISRDSNNPPPYTAYLTIKKLLINFVEPTVVSDGGILEYPA